VVVRTQSDGRTVTGLYIGPRNARRNFPRHIRSVELEIGHLQIHCILTEEFWRGRPEIRDPRLCDWLETRIFRHRACRTPVPIAMVPVGRSVYRLHPFRLPPASLHQLVRIGTIPSADHPRASGQRSCGPVCRPRMYIDCDENAAVEKLEW
jgi:hypothetical protein